MNIDGINSNDIITGYKYFIFSLDIRPISIYNISTDKTITIIIPIVSVGPAVNGNI